MQNLIKYEDILNDKYNYIYLINKIMPIYKKMKQHTQVLECDQWITMLYKRPIKTEYTIDALIALKNIVNDACNYFIVVENRWDDGELGILLIDKITKLIKEYKNDKL